MTKTLIESNVEVYSGTSCQWSFNFLLIHNISILLILKESLSVVTEIVLSNHNISQSLRQKSFSLVPNICISKCGLIKSQLLLIFIWCFLWESK